MLLFPKETKVCFAWGVDLGRGLFKDYQDREEGDLTWENLYMEVADNTFVKIQMLTSKIVTVTDPNSKMNGLSVGGGKIKIYGDPIGEYEEV